jgi:diguanylate cyclase (GGDEF)-like protein
MEFERLPCEQGWPVSIEDRIGATLPGAGIPDLPATPIMALGAVRVVDERPGLEERLAGLPRFDELTGEMNHAHLIETLAATLDEAIRYRSSCGLLVVAIDNLARINEAHGFAVATAVIVSIAKSIRARLRSGDTLGRLSGDKFGIVLKSCTPDDMAAAAERILVTARDTVVSTGTGGVIASVTIGGVVAPRHARTVDDILARAEEALEAANARQCGSYEAYRPRLKSQTLRSAVGAEASPSSRSTARSS